MKSKRGQAMVESVVAVLVIAAALLGAVHLARIVLAKATLSHAAARVARARAVGMNDFMCVKIARASAIGVSGARLWPEQVASEKALVPLYLET